MAISIQISNSSFGHLEMTRMMFGTWIIRYTGYSKYFAGHYDLQSMSVRFWGGAYFPFVSDTMYGSEYHHNLL